MQDRRIENSARNLIRTLEVGCQLCYPYGRRAYLRSLINDAQLDLGHRYQTRLDRQTKELIITRIS